MKIQAWQVTSLPLVECYLSADLSPWASFSHVSTRVRGTFGPEDDRPIGDTVWAGVQGDRAVALAWDWVELRPGVVCLLDPNAVTTNARFMDAQDCYEEPLNAIISANRLIYMWPWQNEVLKRMGEGPKETGTRAPRSRRPALMSSVSTRGQMGVDLRRAA